MKQYRNIGAIGALLDEYEKALNELQHVINNITPDELELTLDPETNNPDCKSIQSILTHVVKAGYGYVRSIRISFGEQVELVQPKKFNSIAEYHKALRNMFIYNETLFNDYPNLRIEQHDNQKKILVSWGQYYDIEQLFEHAIVHVLRHRRQIERFLIGMRKNTC